VRFAIGILVAAAFSTVGFAEQRLQPIFSPRAEVPARQLFPTVPLDSQGALPARPSASQFGPVHKRQERLPQFPQTPPVALRDANLFAGSAIEGVPGSSGLGSACLTPVPVNPSVDDASLKPIPDEVARSFTMRRLVMPRCVGITTR